MQVARTQPDVKHKSQFLVVTVSGTPFEMGVQYGEKARDIVRHSAEYWYSQVAGSTERSPEEMVELVRKSSDVSFKFFHELGEEIQGVRKGRSTSRRSFGRNFQQRDHERQTFVWMQVISLLEETQQLTETNPWAQLGL